MQALLQPVEFGKDIGSFNKDLIDNHIIHREYLNNGTIDFDTNLNNEELYNYIFNFYSVEKNKIINLL